MISGREGAHITPGARASHARADGGGTELVVMNLWLFSLVDTGCMSPVRKELPNCEQTQSP